jgi:hypothetical protein
MVLMTAVSFYTITAYTSTYGRSVLHLADSDAVGHAALVSNLVWLPLMVHSLIAGTPAASAGVRGAPRPGLSSDVLAHGPAFVARLLAWALALVPIRRI